MKTALVTGGSRGIGAAICRALAADGWQVAVNYLHAEEAARSLARELHGVAVQADVSREAEVAAMAARVRRELGEPSLLVNNAGVAQQKLFTELTEEDWDRMFAVHCKGAFLASRAALPGMIRRREGCILNISSMWGETGGSCEVHYSAAKAALIGFTKALAKEVGPSGVRVNAIAPGVIDAGMSASLPPQTLAALREETPLGLLGAPEDVARLAAFLASEGARFITGQVVGVNGGLVI